MFTVRRWIELDAGHRVPYHASKCRNLHGHRYRVTAVVGATELVAAETGRADAGMVVDFGVIKQVLLSVVHDPFDHKLILWTEDPLMSELGFVWALDTAGISRASVMGIPCIPTAEELARYWGQLVAVEFTRLATGLRLEALEVQETPTSVATWTP
jgi:6-pyruvoyltetrahydropterin/6-carboxytetrahydropterin synthase